MPRDATATKERLLREAERLFATRGVFRVKVADIVEAAGQRNVSALSYHFGGRQDVLTAILLRHGTPLDDERGRLVAQLGEARPPASWSAPCSSPTARSCRRPRGAATCASSPS